MTHADEASTRPRLDVAMCMHKGRCPRQQDAMWIGGIAFQHANLLPQVTHSDADALFAIADGVAASPTAARASRVAVQALAECLSAHPDWSFDALVGARHVRTAQQRLCEALAAGRLAYGASTTLVAAHIRDDRLAVVNSGDSRAYLLRRDGTIERLSRDHTERQHLLDSGAAAEGIDYASLYDALSDCLIADPEAQDFAVHHHATTLCHGDRLILCSDGVHDVVEEAAWLSAMVRECDPLQMVDRTRSALLAKGAPDNFSMIVVERGSANVHEKAPDHDTRHGTPRPDLSDRPG